MSFPWHNPSWREAAEFIGPEASRGERILAPDQFWAVVSSVVRYVPANLDPEIVTDPDLGFDWVVLHLHDMPQIPRAFLASVAANMTPAFANDHFVIWRAGTASEGDGNLEGRLADFSKRLEQLGDEPSVPNRYALDTALMDAPQLTRHADLTDAELRTAMDDLFRRTGYLYPTLRDQAYQRDVRQHVASSLGRCAGGRVLDLCSGGKGFGDVPAGTRVTRTELSEVGLRHARAADRERPGLAYVVMDAHQIAFPDASFDCVHIVDSLEHVRDAAHVLREAARVIVTGGELLVTFANVDSIHQVITEKLGYPGWFTNHQHIREFTFGDVAKMLDDTGFVVRATAGVLLYPYWGVPGMESVRHIVDDDPEFVEMMSELGRRVGAEYAYSGVVRAQRV